MTHSFRKPSSSEGVDSHAISLWGYDIFLNKHDQPEALFSLLSTPDLFRSAHGEICFGFLIQNHVWRQQGKREAWVQKTLHL